MAPMSQHVYHVTSKSHSEAGRRFVYTDWEGLAHDSRILAEAIVRPNVHFPVPPPGKYYIVDSSFASAPDYLTPYSGRPYHLSEFHGQWGRFRTKEDLFNYTHSSLRNVIERCFGVLKGKFPILKNMPRYDLSLQPFIVMACFITYNFTKREACEDVHLNIWADEQMINNEDDEANGGDGGHDGEHASTSNSEITLV
ncbi:PREDICTED: uncharacterized protein LOC109113879 [Nelumbo nucifera]|uniref:Uncharacterized protein LOC109113879 n=1 Tax=Nelumbo nucifera TaxID=4432 RepID=A0A1U8Q7Z0_NELNU|nr:PREDICTED: uncharacterized protein LOC109113879 [Nelumbo nucifera]